MKIKFCFLFLIICSVLSSQPIKFSYGNFTNILEVPVDTQWREYKIPYKLLIPNELPYVGEARFILDTNSSIQLPTSSTYWVDQIHFPTNSWEFFEDTNDVSIWFYLDEGTTLDYQYSNDTPDSGLYSLSFTYSADSVQPSFTFMIGDPLWGYPTIPDTVGFYLKGETSADLRQFIPLNIGNLWQWENQMSGHGYVSEITSAVFTDCSATWATNEWLYMNGIATLSHKVYDTDINHPDKVWEKELPWNWSIEWDFGLLPGQYNPRGPIFPVDEYYGIVLGSNFFIKIFEPQMYIWYNSWHFAYGIGMVRHYESMAGVDSLIGAKIDNRYIGNIRFENTVTIGVDFDSVSYSYYDIKTFPDSAWYQYKIPLSELNLPFDSTGQVSFGYFYIKPTFFHFNPMDIVTSRIILVDEISVLPHSDGDVPFIIDVFEGGLGNWFVMFGLDGSGIDLELSTDSPMDYGFSMRIDFWNGLSQNFEGLAKVRLDMIPEIQFHMDDTLSLWIKEIKEYGIIQDENPSVSEEFVLHQNCPNPFNPITTIRFDLPEDSDVQLVIYDILGREVEKLVSSRLVSGEYRMDWNAGDVASVIYFYSLFVRQDGILSYGETKKLVVLK